MGILSFIFGILVMIFLVLGLIPFLGWINWINIPFAVVGAALAVVDMIIDRPKGLSLVGVILCSIAIVIGGLRLIVGGGIL